MYAAHSAAARTQHACWQYGGEAGECKVHRGPDLTCPGVPDNTLTATLSAVHQSHLMEFMQILGAT